MPNIDEQVVKMTFDNQQFEKGVSQSLKSIEDLKKSLELDKMSNSLSKLELVSDTINNSLNDLASNAQRVANVFTPLGKVVDKFYTSIANKMIGAAKSFEGMTLGFSELDAGKKKYEEYTKAVQTITNATGKSVKDVSKTLDILAKYTDETSYDFSEMVKSIGKFTSVGIDLERAEAAMEGIANWAAKSGAGKQEANRAMYNISQAMGAGALKLIDWKSIENANMATKEFKEVAIQTAEALGTLGKGTVTYQNFNETLKEGWLTADVLTRVLEKYADTTTDFGKAAFKAAQEALTWTDALDALKDAISSGWMRTMELLFGNLDEARKLWTDVANAMIEFASIFSEWRNDLLQGWHDLGGYNDMVEAASNIWQTFMNIVYGVGDALHSVFEPLKSEALVDFTKQIKQASEDLLAAFGIDTFTEVTDTYTETIDKAKELDKVLKRGDKGDYTKKLQGWLIKRGFLDKGQADGIFGPKTEDAVKKLQKSIGVDLTGVWDDATRKAVSANKLFTEKVTKETTSVLKNVEAVEEEYETTINHAKKLNVDLSRGSKNDYVKKLQKRLIKMGLLSDKTGADGIYGPKTEEAVRKLQKKLGVDVTGAWDAATRAAAETSTEFNEVVKKTREVYVETEGLTSPMERLQSIVSGILSVVKTAWMFIKGAASVAIRVLHIFDPLVSVFGRLFSMVSGMFYDLQYELGNDKTIEGWADGIMRFLQPVADVITLIAIAIDDFISSYAAFLRQTGGFNSFGNFFQFLLLYLKHNPIIGPIIGIVETVISILLHLKDMVFTIVGDIIGWVIGKLNDLFSSGSLGNAILNSLGSNGLLGALYRIVGSVISIFQMIGSYITYIISSILGRDITKRDAEKSGIANVLDTLVTIITVAANAIAMALAIVAQGVFFLITTVGKYAAPIIAFVAQLLTGLGSQLVSGQIGSIPGLLVAIGKSFAQTSVGSKLLGNVGKHVKEFYETVQKFLVEKFPSISKSVGEEMNTIGGMLSFDNNKSLLQNIKDKFIAIGNWIIEKFNKVKSFIETRFPALVAFIQTAIENLKTVFSYDPTQTFVQNIKNSLTGLQDFIANVIGFIAYCLYQLGKSIATLFAPDPNTKSIPIIDILAEKLKVFEPIVNWFIQLKDKIVGAFRELLNVGSEGTDDGTGFVSVLDRIKQALVSVGKMGFEKLIIPAVMAFAGYHLVKGIKSIGEFVGNVDKNGLVGVLLGKGGDDDDEGFADTLTKIAGSVVAISLALGLLDILDYNKVKQGLGAFVVILGSIVGTMFAIKKLNLDKVELGEVFGGIGQGIWSIVKAIGIMMVLFFLMEKFKSLQSAFTSALIAIGAIFVVLGGVYAAMAVFTKKNRVIKINGIKEICDGILTIVLAMAGLMFAVKAVKDEGAVWLAWGIIELLIGTLGFMVFAISKWGKQEDLKFGGFVSLCAGMFILVQAYIPLMKEIKAIGDPGAVWSAFAIMEVLLATLGAIPVLMSVFGKDAGKTVANAALVAVTALGICLMVEALAKAINLIKDVNPEVITWFAAGLAAALLGLVAVIGIFSAIGGENALLVDVALLVLVGVIAAAIATLSAVTTNALDQFTKVLKHVGDRLLSFSQTVNQIQWEGVNTATEWLQNGLKMLISYIILNGAGSKDAVEILEDLYSIGINLKHFADYVSTITQDNIDKADLAKTLVEKGEGIATAAESISLPENVEDGKLALLAGHLLNYTSLLDKTPEEDKTDKALSMVQGANDIAAAMNALTVNDGVEDSLVLVGSALGLYYIELAKIGKVGADGEKLAEEFDPSDIEIDSETITKVMQGLADAIPEGAAETIAAYKEGGSNDMAGAALGIEALGTALGNYGTSIGTLDAGQVKSANDIIEAVKGIDQYMKDTKIDEASGYLKDNNSSISEFSGYITTLGGALGNYGDLIGQKVKKDDVEAANLVIEEFMKLGTHLNGEDKEPIQRLLSRVFGTDENEEIEDFSTNIEKVGGSLASYATNISGLDDGKVKIANNLLDHIAHLARIIPETGGLFQWASGSKDLLAFSEGMVDLGEGMVKFQAAVNGNTTGLEGTILDNDKLEEGFKALERIMEWGSKFFDNNYFEDNNYILKFEAVVTALSNSVTTLGNLSTKKVGEGWGKEGLPIFTAITTISEQIAEGIGKGIFDSEETNASIATAIGGTVANAISSAENSIRSDSFRDVSVLSKIKALCKELLKQIADGLVADETANNQIKIGIETVLNTALTSVTNFYDKFAEAGKYLNEGLVVGLIKNSGLVARAMHDIAQGAALDTLLDTWDEHSPSKKSEKASENFVKGSAIGISENAYLLSNAVKKDIGDKVFAEYQEQLKNGTLATKEAAEEALEAAEETFIGEGHYTDLYKVDRTSTLDKIGGFISDNAFTGNEAARRAKEAIRSGVIGPIINAIDEVAREFVEEDAQIYSELEDQKRRKAWREENYPKEAERERKILEGMQSDDLDTRAKAYVDKFADSWWSKEAQQRIDHENDKNSEDIPLVRDAKAFANGLYSAITGTPIDQVELMAKVVKGPDKEFEPDIDSILFASNKSGDSIGKTLINAAEYFKANPITDINTGLQAIGNIFSGKALAENSFKQEDWEAAVKKYYSQYKSEHSGNPNYFKEFLGLLGFGLKSTGIIGGVLGKTIVSQLSEYFGEKDTEYFLDIGKNIILGIVGGLINPESRKEMKTAADVVGTALIEAVKAVLGIHSPSTEFEWIGMMAALGLKNGYDKYGQLVIDSGINLAEASLTEIMAAFDKSKLPQVAMTAYNYINDMLGDTDWKNLTNKQKNVVKDFLVFMGYLDEQNRSDDHAVSEAVRKFKREVLGQTGKVSGRWDASDTKELEKVMSKSIDGNYGNYTQEKYEKELYEATRKDLMKDSTNEEKRKLYDDAKHAYQENEQAKKDAKKAEKEAEQQVKDAEKLAKDTEKMLNTNRFNMAYYMDKIYGVGNVKLSQRPIVFKDAMKKAGWTEYDGDYATLYSSTFTAGDKSKGYYDFEYDDEVIIDATPILPNGDILSPKAFEDYIETILQSSEGVLAADDPKNGGLGLVMRFGEVTGSLDEAIEESEKWTNDLHEVQSKYYTKEAKRLYKKEKEEKKQEEENRQARTETQRETQKEIERKAKEEKRAKESAAIERWQKMLESYGYLETGSYEKGINDTITKVAMKEFKSNINAPIGTDLSNFDYSGKEELEILQSIENKGIKPLLKRVPTEDFYVKEDKRNAIKEEAAQIDRDKRQRKESIKDWQNLLEEYGFLEYGKYKEGTIDSATKDAMTRFNREILQYHGSRTIDDKSEELFARAVDKYDGDVDKLMEDRSGKKEKETQQKNIKVKNKKENETIIYGHEQSFNSIKEDTAILTDALKNAGYNLMEGKNANPYSDKAFRDFLMNVIGYSEEEVEARLKNSALFYRLMNDEEQIIADYMRQHPGMSLSEAFEGLKKQNTLNNKAPFGNEWMTNSVFGIDSESIDPTGLLGKFGNMLGTDGSLDPTKFLGNLSSFDWSSAFSFMTPEGGLNWSNLFSLDTAGTESIMGFGENFGEAFITPITSLIDGNLFGTGEDGSNGLIGKIAETILGPGVDIKEGIVGAIGNLFLGDGNGEGGLVGKLKDTVFGESGMLNSAFSTFSLSEEAKSGVVNTLTDVVNSVIGNVFGGGSNDSTTGNTGTTSTDSNLRPVLDATSISDGTKTGFSNAMKASGSPLLATATSVKQAQTIAGEIKTNDAAWRAQDRTNDAKIAGKVDALGNKIDIMNTNLMNTKIVLDSNALVVGTVAQMDRALGRRGFVGGRRV